MITETQKMREEYFKARGLPPPPVDQEARFERSREYIEKIPSDLEAVLMLFDPDEDKEHAGWLLLMGWIFDRHQQNSYFDAAKGLQFYLAASDRGHSSASFNIAIKYLNGEENKIDLDAAIYWFQKSKDQGHQNAAYLLFRLQAVHDWRYYNPMQPEFRRAVDAQIVKAMNEGSFLAQVHVTKIIGAGKTYRRDHAYLNTAYEKIMDHDPQNHEQPIKYWSVFRWALRNYLGLGVLPDPQKALSLLAAIPAQTNHVDINLTINDLSKKLKAIIAADFRDPEAYGALQISVQKAYQDNTDPTFNDFQGDIDATIDIFWCVDQLAQGEGWPNQDKWKECLRTAQAAKLGIRYEDVLTSTSFAGPRYNPVGKNGMPVLGVWEPPARDEEEAERQMMDTGSYVPEAGVVKFKGLMAKPGGTITFDFIKASDTPAYLVPEDFEIALTLAFGNPDGMKHPYLSLEAPARHGLDDKYETFLFKEWNPAWLGYTDLGRTLYMTDQIGSICWHPREFDVGGPDQTFDPRMSEYALDLLEDIALTGGRQGEGSSSRIMWIPEHISTEVKQDATGRLVINVAEVKMRMDGSYIIDQGKDGENRLIALNDDMYKQGRTVNKITQRYNDIAAVMPVFVRLQELMGLMQACRQLREEFDKRGWTFDPKLQARMEAKYRYMESLPPLPLHERLCVHLPLMYKRI